MLTDMFEADMFEADMFEADLREALARRAAEVPPQVGDRLRLGDYRPRGHSPVPVAAVGLAAAVLAAGGVFLAGATAGTPGHAPAVARLAGATIRLDGYQFTLPAGYKPTSAPCTAPLRAGLSGTPVPGGAAFVAGAAAHGGCVEAVLSGQGLTPPGWAVPVQVGHHRGYVMSQPQGDRITLYVDLSGAAGPRWLVITAKQLSQSQVVTLATRALARPASQPAGPSPSQPASEAPSPSPSEAPTPSPAGPGG
jgi:hypothetical protein